MSRPTAVSLFSGCGGFDWGASSAGVDIIWANDVDPHATFSYRSLFPNVKLEEGDIRSINRFPEADILIGCYPCTGFSVGSRRRWRKRRTRDLSKVDHNFLYRHFIRALRQVRPKFLFIENVRGMASANDGWFLQRQLKGLRSAGYEIKCEVLNACDFGVPQSRKRLFIVGTRRGIRFDYQFPQPTHGPVAGKCYVTLDHAIGKMPDWPKGEFFEYPFHGHYLTRNRKRPWDDVSYTIVADAHQVPLHPVGEPMKFICKDTWTLQGVLNRRLSWRECSILQSLPSRMARPDSLFYAYRVVGNAVPPDLPPYSAHS